MSVLSLDNRGLVKRTIGSKPPTGGGQTFSSVPEWAWPPHSLPIPIIGSEEAGGIVHIREGSGTGASIAWINVQVSGAPYTYTVDWGDGSSDTLGTNIPIEHEYNWSTLSYPATVNISGDTDTISWTSHGLEEGDVIAFFSLSNLFLGLVEGRQYYARSVTENTFKVAKHRNSSTMSLLSGMGTASPSPEKQVHIKITGSGLSHVDLSAYPGPETPTSLVQWRYWYIKGMGITSIVPPKASQELETWKVLLDTAIDDYSNICSDYMRLQNADDLKTNYAGDYSGLYFGCGGLRGIPSGTDLSLATNLSGAFGEVYGVAVKTSMPLITSLPTLYLPLCTAMLDTFSRQKHITHVSIRSMGNMTSLDGAFSSTALSSAYLASHNVTNFDHVFSNCRFRNTDQLYVDTRKASTFRGYLAANPLLTRVRPALQSSSSVILAGIYEFCESLQECPEPILATPSAGATTSLAFRGCPSLTKVSTFRVFGAVNIDAHLLWTFRECFGLREATFDNPENYWSTSSDTEGSGLFTNCINLREVGPITFQNRERISLGSMFIGCHALQYTPPLHVPKAVYPTAGNGLAANFDECYSLMRVGTDFNVTNMQDRSVLNGMVNFGNCHSLQKVNLEGSQLGIGLSNTKMSSEALNEMYRILLPVTDQVGRSSSLGSTGSSTDLGVLGSSVFNGTPALLGIKTPTVLGFLVDSAPGSWGLQLETTKGRMSSLEHTKSASLALGGLEILFNTGTLITPENRMQVDITGSPGAGGDSPSIAEVKGYVVIGS